MARGEWLVAASVAAISAVTATARRRRRPAVPLEQPRREPHAPTEALAALDVPSPLDATAEAPSPPQPGIRIPRPTAELLPGRPPLRAPGGSYGLIPQPPPLPEPPRVRHAFADDATEPPRPAVAGGPLVDVVPNAGVDVELLGTVVAALAHAYPLAGSSSLDVAGASYVRARADSSPPSPRRLAVLLWPLLEALGMEGRIDADSEGVTLLTTACPLLEAAEDRRPSMCELVCGEHASLLRGAAAAGGATIRAPSRMGEGAPFCMRRLAMTPAE